MASGSATDLVVLASGGPSGGCWLALLTSVVVWCV